MSKVTNITCCRLCESEDIIDLHSFGPTASANAYIKLDDFDKPEEKFGLTLVLCNKCGILQLKETLDREFLFSDYLYASSSSGSLSTYFKGYTDELITTLNLKPEQGYILEPGSNDGVCLQHFKDKGFNVIGVEPAANLVKISSEKGIFTINTFFGETFAKHLYRQYGYPACIVCSNTYAHLSEHKDFTQGIRNLLKDMNYFVFENAYALDTIKNLYFDQVYSDHLLYVSVKPFVEYFKKFDLEIFRVERTPIQGGSIRVFVARQGTQVIQESVEEAIKEEDDFGLDKKETYDKFFANLKVIQEKFQKTLQKYLSEGKTISCYGCPAKFALFSKVFGINNENCRYVVDDSVYKQNLLAPESKIQIVDRNFFINYPTDICIVSAWNFEEMIRKNNSQYQGVWINPLNL